ncbi:hypothetical protein HmCmsJML164_04343 [Escherichia coli]|nr:hypothetical protein HmCmsJML164_04343 [Escherichia coli]
MITSKSSMPKSFGNTLMKSLKMKCFFINKCPYFFLRVSKAFWSTSTPNKFSIGFMQPISMRLFSQLSKKPQPPKLGSSILSVGLLIAQSDIT